MAGPERLRWRPRPLPFGRKALGGLGVRLLRCVVKPRGEVDAPLVNVNVVDEAVVGHISGSSCAVLVQVEDSG